MLAIAVALGTGCGGSSLTASSTCKEFLKASQQDQDAIVTKLAEQYKKPDFVTPLGRPEVPYYCTANPDSTLGQLFSKP